MPKAKIILKGKLNLESITKDLKNLKGSLPKPKRPITLEEMKTVIKTRKWLWSPKQKHAVN